MITANGPGIKMAEAMAIIPAGIVAGEMAVFLLLFL
jgi:hypothetical protein